MGSSRELSQRSLLSRPCWLPCPPLPPTVPFDAPSSPLPLPPLLPHPYCPPPPAPAGFFRHTVVTPTESWQLSIGQCPQFTDAYLRQALLPTARIAAFTGVVWLVAALVVATLLFAVRWHEKDVKLRVATAKHAER